MSTVSGCGCGRTDSGLSQTFIPILLLLASGRQESSRVLLGIDGRMRPSPHGAVALPLQRPTVSIPNPWQKLHAPRKCYAQVVDLVRTFLVLGLPLVG